MMHRVILSTSSDPTSHASEPVDVQDAKHLRRELEQLGAKRFARYWRDAHGLYGHVEGEFRPVEAFDEEDFTWVTARVDLQHREIAYDTRR